MNNKVNSEIVAITPQLLHPNSMLDGIWDTPLNGVGQDVSTTFYTSSINA